jgi:hypothetical protein
MGDTLIEKIDLAQRHVEQAQQLLKDVARYYTHLVFVMTLTYRLIRGESPVPTSPQNYRSDGAESGDELYEEKTYGTESYEHG